MVVLYCSVEDENNILGDVVVNANEKNLNVHCNVTLKEDMKYVLYLYWYHRKKEQSPLRPYNLQIDFLIEVNNDKDADIVLLAVPGFLGFDALKTIIERGKDIVDISFSPENVLILHDLAVKNDVCAVVDAGVAPGIPNFVLGYWNSQLEVEAFEYVVGGLPKNPIPPYYYKAPFSPIDVIEEYTRPARMMIDSKVKIKPALSDIEELKIDDVGLPNLLLGSRKFPVLIQKNAIQKQSLMLLSLLIANI